MHVALTDPLEQRINDLIEDHKRIVDEPLLLALRYEPTGDSKDIYILEIVDGFGGGAVDSDKELMEASFGSSDTFPLPKGVRVHLVLTNPHEFEIALKEGWPSIQEIRKAIQNHMFQVLFMGASGERLLQTLQS